MKRENPSFSSLFNMNSLTSVYTSMCLVLFLCLPVAFSAKSVETKSCKARIFAKELNYTKNFDFITNNNTTPIPPSKMKPRHINVAFLTSLSHQGSGRLYGGAFFLAIDELNSIAARDGLPVTFNWTFRDAGNHEPIAINQMAKLRCENRVSAFIGPDAYCKPAGLMATAFHIPYMTYVSTLFFLFFTHDV